MPASRAPESPYSHKTDFAQIGHPTLTRHWGFVKTSRRSTARDLSLRRKALLSVSYVRDVSRLDGKCVASRGEVQGATAPL